MNARHTRWPLYSYFGLVYEHAFNALNFEIDMSDSINCACKALHQITSIPLLFTPVLVAYLGLIFDSSDIKRIWDTFYKKRNFVYLWLRIQIKIPQGPWQCFIKGQFYVSKKDNFDLSFPVWCFDWRFKKKKWIEITQKSVKLNARMLWMVSQ